MSLDPTQTSEPRTERDGEEAALAQKISQLKLQIDETTPISTLPFDVLERIFLLCREAKYDSVCERHACCSPETNSIPTDEQIPECDPFDHCSRHGFLINLALVCKSWHFFVFATPTFWNIVDLTYPITVLQAMSDLRKDVPVSVHADSSVLLCCDSEITPSFLEDVEASFGWVLQNCPRIKRISLALPMKILRDFFMKFTPRLAEMKALDLLDIQARLDTEAPDENQELSGWGNTESYQSLNGVSLVSLRLDRIEFPPFLTIANVSHLRYLRVNLPTFTAGTFRGIWDVIEKCSPTLKVLSLGNTDTPLSKSQLDLDLDLSRDFEAYTVRIQFPNLERLHIKRWRILAVILSNVIVAPNANCIVTFSLVDHFATYSLAKPISRQWAQILGDYHITTDSWSSLYFQPVKVVNTITQATIRRPIVTIKQVSTPLNGWHTAVRRVKEISRYHVAITEAELNIRSLNETFHSLPLSHYRPHNAGTTFKKIYANLGDIGDRDLSLEALDMMSHKRQRPSVELTGILTELPELRTLTLTGLTGCKDGEYFLGGALELGSRKLQKDASATLNLKYDVFLQPEDAVYLPWLHWVLITHDPSSEFSPRTPIRNVNIEIPSFYWVLDRELVDGKTLAQVSVEAQVKEIVKRTAGRVAISVCLHHDYVTL